MAVIRLTVVALIVSALCVVAHAQEAKPCPSGHICPICRSRTVSDMPGRETGATAGVAARRLRRHGISRRRAVLRHRHRHRRHARSFASARLSSPCGRLASGASLEIRRGSTMGPGWRRVPSPSPFQAELEMKTHHAVALAIVSAIAGAGLVQTLHAQGKPKAYTIAELDVTDAAKFKPYVDGTAVIVPQAGGRFIALGGKTFVIGGAPPRS